MMRRRMLCARKRMMHQVSCIYAYACTTQNRRRAANSVSVGTPRHTNQSPVRIASARAKEKCAVRGARLTLRRQSRARQCTMPSASAISCEQPSRKLHVLIACTIHVVARASSIRPLYLPIRPASPLGPKDRASRGDCYPAGGGTPREAARTRPQPVPLPPACACAHPPAASRGAAHSH